MLNADVVIVGGGIGGSSLATVLAKRGKNVVVLERETTFKDRVRGENMLPWGVAAARRLGVLDELLAAGGRFATFFNIYAMGMQTEHRSMPQTTPTGERMLNMYHPDMQETLLASAAQAGADIRRGAVVQNVSQQNGAWTVSFTLDGKTHALTPRIVVGADGRSSHMRKWGGFTVNHDPERLRIAGALVQRSSIPEDSAYLCLGPGNGSFLAPLGNGRARMYFVYIGAMGARKLSGKEKIEEFIAALRSSLAPSDWFDGIEVIGPLAEFEGNDHWVTSPTKPGLALIGDAAAATDPSWGCGLSKTLLDVQTLSECLLDADDWTIALERYAAVHDQHYAALHRTLSWMAELVWSSGPAADERRARVFPRMSQDPTGFPDSIGQGPFGPSDDRARRLILGEE